MTADTSSRRPADTPDTGGSSTLINALIGAAAGIILTFIPLSTLLGGAVAGYLEDGEPTEGMKVGAIAGLIMLIPFVFMGLFFVLFFLGFGARGAPIAFGLMGFFVLTFGALYTVGLSAVGGYLGVYLKDEL
ncbi:DUF5518 domain-containing protein [Natronosalvus halobius]|uniref:DUF5518 domain-containing protein n=1 Tax=Natronosalvus halobius TaxID=2953746 RepID=UPI00209D49BA|nr:DUF5518 domain-containing protein [Natronosalvus halobius]USZ70420.1 DUF5518 domain-containing protein [Natronosalvus halobius]